MTDEQFRQVKNAIRKYSSPADYYGADLKADIEQILSSPPDAAVDDKLFDDGMDIALRYDLIKKHLSITEKSELTGITTLFDYHNAMIEYAALRTAPMQAEIDRLTSALTDAESKAAVWKRVEDGLPELSKRGDYPKYVLATNGIHSGVAAFMDMESDDNDNRWEDEHREEISEITHWMPLPAPPQTFQNEKGK